MDFIRALDDPMSVEAVRSDTADHRLIAVMVLIFYFLLIRPQRKRDKAEKEMRSSIAPGDEISTIGGIVGKVISVKDDRDHDHRDRCRPHQAENVHLGHPGVRRMRRPSPRRARARNWRVRTPWPRRNRKNRIRRNSGITRPAVS